MGHSPRGHDMTLMLQGTETAGGAEGRAVALANA